MDLMNDSGVTVWLDTPAECIFERLRRNRSRRPLIAGMTDGELRGFIAGALAEREPFMRVRPIVSAASCLRTAARLMSLWRIL